MVERAKHINTDKGSQELQPADFIRKILVESELHTTEEALKLHPVFVESDHETSYYVSDGPQDLLIKFWGDRPDNRELRWSKSGHKRNSPFTLRGLLQENKVCKIAPSEVKLVVIHQLTSDTGYNAAMRQLERTPSEDCFELIPYNMGDVPDRNYPELATLGMIPIATGHSYFIEHDRQLTDHVTSWWSTPPDTFKAIKRKASSTLKKNDPEWDRVFVKGLDGLAIFTHDMVKKTHTLIDTTWKDLESVYERLIDAGEFVDTYAEDPTGSTSYYFHPLVSLGLLEGQIDKNGRLTTIQNATERSEYECEVETGTKKLVRAYMANITDIFLRLDNIQGPPFEESRGLAKRAEFAERLMEQLAA